tara:strand:- start:10582 stop:11787 length:1206 start_codon:yes stop_codon:yes gene_type:complete
MADKSNYYDPENDRLFNPETGMDATGRMYFAPQATADYMAKEGTIGAYEPTMREKDRSALANFLQEYGGLSKIVAQDAAEGIYGNAGPDPRNAGGIGIADFIPIPSLNTGLNMGLVYASEEAARDIGKAQTATDYIAPSINLGLSAVEALPFAKAVTRPIKGFLSSLGRKTSSDIFPNAEPLIASAGPKIPRRTFVQGMAATPVAGALSKLPLGKIDDVAPVAKVARVALPKDFNILRDLPSAKNLIDEILEGDIKTYDYDFVNPDNLEDVGDDIMDLVDQVPDSDRFNVADTYDEVRESIKEELMDIYKMSDKEADNLMIKEGFDLPVTSAKEISRMKSFKGSFIDYKETFPNSRINFKDWEGVTGLKDIRDIKVPAKGTKVESDEFADRKAMIEKMLGN